MKQKLLNVTFILALILPVMGMSQSNTVAKLFDKYSDVKTAIKGALQSYKTHANQLQSLVTKSWGSQGLEKQIKKLEDEHGVMPGKQLPEIPPEQATVTDVSDPEEDKDKLN